MERAGITARIAVVVLRREDDWQVFTTFDEDKANEMLSIAYANGVLGMRSVQLVDCDSIERVTRSFASGNLSPGNSGMATPNPARWAELLVQRDHAQGPKVLERMLEFYEENDGKADDFGRLFIVMDALRALGRE